MIFFKCNVQNLMIYCYLRGLKTLFIFYDGCNFYTSRPKNIVPNTVFESYNLCHISVVDFKEIAAEHKRVHMTELQLYMENKCIKILSGFIRMN